MWKVEVTEYVVDDYWFDYPPFEFASESDARRFADTQTGARTKVRRVYSTAAQVGIGEGIYGKGE